MANLCSFQMEIRGSIEGILKFFNALTQEGDVWMGRGADATLYLDEKNESASIDGCCKWSIQSALIDDAMSMDHQKKTGKGYWSWDKESQKRDYITLFEACKKYHVNMEVYSEECGCEFQEHYKYENGYELEDCVDYSEEYDEETDEYISTGGYESWDFDLKPVA